MSRFLSFTGIGTLALALTISGCSSSQAPAPAAGPRGSLALRASVVAGQTYEIRLSTQRTCEGFDLTVREAKSPF